MPFFLLSRNILLNKFIYNHLSKYEMEKLSYLIKGKIILCCPWPLINCFSFAESVLDKKDTNYQLLET
jgi:hypothetical protein